MPISREVRDRAPDPFLKVSELNKEIETLKRELSVQSLLTRGKSTMGRLSFVSQFLKSRKRTALTFSSLTLWHNRND